MNEDDLLWQSLFQDELINWNTLTTLKRPLRDQPTEEDKRPCYHSPILIQTHQVAKPVPTYPHRAIDETLKPTLYQSCVECIRLSQKCLINQGESSCQLCLLNGCECRFAPKKTVTKYDLTFTNKVDIHLLSNQ